MKHLFLATSLLALAACGSGDETQNQQESTPPASTTQEPSQTSALIEKAQKAAAQAVESLKLDTSSLESFKSSLSSMQASLSNDQAGQLSSALTSLAKSAPKEKGGLVATAKNLAAGKSIEETLYETLGDKLNGMSFDDIINLAS